MKNAVHAADLAIMCVLRGMVESPAVEELLLLVADKHKGHHARIAHSTQSILELPMAEAVLLSFNTCDNQPERIQLLSILRGAVTLAQFNAFQNRPGKEYPPVSSWLWGRARKHAECWGAGRAAPAVSIRRTRLPQKMLGTMLAFVSSSENLQQVAYGVKTMYIAETGAAVTIPLTFRTKLKEHLFEAYRSEHTDPETGDFIGMSRSVFLKALTCATGLQQTSLGALDNIAVHFGTETFDGLRALIAQLGACGLPSTTSDSLLRLLESVQNHIKHDLHSHLRDASTCAAHCYNHLLSDPADPRLARECGDACGGHTARCAQCDGWLVLFARLEAVCVAIAGGTEQQASDRLWQLQVYKRRFIKYLTHEIRGHFERRVRTTWMEDSLADDNFVIIIDWKMKFLPLRTYEPSWFVFVCFGFLTFALWI